MTIKIIKGDPFNLTVSVRAKGANTDLDFSTGWTANVEFRKNTITGELLAGNNETLSTGKLAINVPSNMTDTWPICQGVMLLKLTKNDGSIPVIRGKYDVAIVKEFI
jgi:hypothetical protein